MGMATIAGSEVHVNEEGFLTEFDEWNEDIGAELAKNIKFENKTGYDQLLNEQLPSNMKDYFLGTITEEEALQNFYKYVNEKYPAIVTP